MKVLLTGASGFVGSHVLDSLRARNIDTVLLLRAGSSRRFIQQHLTAVEGRPGSFDDPASLRAALAGVSHVIHCAGATKALGRAAFMEANQVATRRLVEAAKALDGQVQRFVHISSLAVGGPASPEHPAREEDAPKPVSVYGRSKLAGEMEVAQGYPVPFVILRPPGVYGPRDAGFLSLFKGVKAHLRLNLVGGPRALSLVFVRDLAEVIVATLTHPQAAGRTYYVASPEVVPSARLAEEIAAQMGVWTMPLPLPVALLWPVCLAQEAVSRLTGRPSLLGLQKHAELRAPGWVCDPSRLQRELGLICRTPLKEGVAETLAWYRREGWL